jgi:hypothetical protein
MNQCLLDFDQYILLSVYPCAVIFGIGFIAKRGKIRESLKFVLQSSASIIFSLIYFEGVPDGGADGLAVVLLVFGVLLLFMARKYIIHPEAEVRSERTSTSSNDI